MNEGRRESYFDGGLLGLLGWSLLGFLVTICTIGIAYPWAVCMTEGWKVRHTVINGRRLTFNGTGGQLFGNYIKWFLLTIITLGIYGFWLSIKMIKWVTKHTAFEDGGEAESYFDGTLLQNIGYNLLLMLISACTFGLAFPWGECMLQDWKIKHTVVNGTRLSFDGTGGQLFGNYIKWFLLTIITLGIYSFWLNIKMIQWIVKHETY